MRRLAAIASFVMAVVVGVLGCARVEGTLPTVAAPTPTGEMRAGAARIDITPPPGYPMAGHSIEGEIGLGVWTRLSARAIYLEDAQGRPVVLVACDLWGIPAGLVDSVAARLSTNRVTAHIGRPHLVVSASHTHHGPGNYATAEVYNDLASPEDGFDPDLFAFLVDRISTAIVRAVSQRRPARLHRHTAAVPTIARNRSLAPFLENPEAQDILAANDELPGCGPLPPALGGHGDIDVCHAVDPLLETLHVTSATDPDETIALAGFFAVHATAMPNRTEVYHGDLFVTATSRAEDALRRDDAPVVALFNGAEGDVSPNWSKQGRPATVALGDGLAEAMIASLDEPGTEVTGPFETYYAVVPVADTIFVDDDGQRHRTGRRAIPGYGMAGGAEDGRTRWYRRGWQEGVVARRVRARGHGHKRPLVPVPLLALAQPRRNFPLDVPVGVLDLQGLVLATLPGEFTTVMGRRIATEIATALGRRQRVVTVGLAGEYLSYFTTPQEYALQHYEGASTLYGVDSGPLVADHFDKLIRTRTVDPPQHYSYRPGPRDRHDLHDLAARRKVEGVVDRVVRQLDALPRDHAVELRVDDVPAVWPPADAHAPTTPRPRIEALGDEGWQPLVLGGRPATDDGDGFVTVVEAIDDVLHWRMLWLTPRASSSQQKLRWVVQRVDGSTHCSQTFSLAQHWRGELPRPMQAGPCTDA